MAGFALTPEQVERLRALHEDNRLTAEDVVSDAKKPSSPLHPLFDWDKDAAAHAWWLERARRIIRSVRYVITTETITINAVRYVPDPDKPHDEQGYIVTDDASTDDDTLRRALVQEIDRALGFMRRAHTFALGIGMEMDSASIIAAWLAWRDAAEADVAVPVALAAD